MDNKHKILIIDDEPDKVSYHIDLILNDYSSQMVTAKNGDIEYIKCETLVTGMNMLHDKNERKNVRIILLDKVIGDDPEIHSIDIKETLEKFKNEYPEQKIVVLTNYLQNDDHIHALNMGASWAFDKHELFQISSDSNVRTIFASFLDSVITSQSNLQKQLIKEEKIRDLFSSTLNILGYTSRAQHIVEGCLNIFDYLHRATIKILIKEEEKTIMLRIAGVNKENKKIKMNEKFNLNVKMLANQVLNEKKAIYIPDVIKWVNEGGLYLSTDDETNSEFCVPLLRKKEIFALLNLESKETNIFTKSDRYMIRMLSDYAASFLNNAIFLDKMSKGLNKVLAGYKNISNQPTKNPFLYFIQENNKDLSYLMEQISEFVGADVVYIFVPKDNVMKCIASLGKDKHSDIEKTKKSLVWKVFKEKTIFKGEVTKDVPYCSPPEGKKKYSYVLPFFKNLTDKKYYEDPLAILNIERNNADWSDFDSELVKIFSQLIYNYISIVSMENEIEMTCSRAIGAEMAFAFTHDFNQQLMHSKIAIEDIKNYIDNHRLNKAINQCEDVIKRLDKFRETYTNIKQVINKVSHVPQFFYKIIQIIINKLKKENNFNEEIEIFLRTDNDKEINFDATTLEYILKPIFTNAIIHGKPPIKIEVWINEDNWIIDVWDNGEGINLSKCPDNFFVKKDEKITSIFSASSLSCRIAQHLIREIFKGDICIIKTDKNGTCISINGEIEKG